MELNRKQKLTLMDIKPEEFTFELSSRPGKTYTLGRFSLAEQIWCEEHFGGAEKVREIWSKQQLVPICEITHQLLKDKTDFPTFMDLAKCVITMQDKISLVRGCLATIGISKPVIEKLAADLTPEETPLDPKTQAPSESL